MSAIKVGVDYIPLNALMGNFINQKTSNEQSKARCSQCDKWGCSHRNLKTDICDLEKYETHITNKIEY